MIGSKLFKLNIKERENKMSKSLKIIAKEKVKMNNSNKRFNEFNKFKKNYRCKKEEEKFKNNGKEFKEILMSKF